MYASPRPLYGPLDKCLEIPELIGMALTFGLSSNCFNNFTSTFEISIRNISLFGKICKTDSTDCFVCAIRTSSENTDLVGVYESGNFETLRQLVIKTMGMSFLCIVLSLVEINSISL
jgi:hypothetical protein